MAYLLESLGDERFQQLCQAILVSTFPDVQCLPVGQPDGGRDAFRRGRNGTRKAETVVFQVKFSRDPNSREERDAIEQTVKTEKKKIERLIELGARRYYLLTNVAGTSHPGAGSIDKVNAELSEALGIESYCWWRDDLERRIDGLQAIKWSYPEIIRSVDLLQVLVEGTLESSRTRIDALRVYMAHQFRQDAQLKFKQIDLQKDIEGRA